MIFDWFNIINRDAFTNTGLYSRTITVFLEGIGEETLLVTQANSFGITFRDVFLPLNFEDQNPFFRGGYAIFEDDNGDVWIGIEVDE